MFPFKMTYNFYSDIHISLTIFWPALLFYVHLHLNKLTNFYDTDIVAYGPAARQRLENKQTQTAAARQPPELQWTG
jgi:hypothetical protein